MSASKGEDCCDCCCLTVLESDEDDELAQVEDLLMSAEAAKKAPVAE